MRVKSLRVAATLALVVPASVGCGGFEFASQWRDREIEVDGVAKDWQGLVEPAKELEAEVGALNDGESLYLCLITRDPSVENQIMLRGLTLWFDALGGDEKSLGVRFPLGLLESDAGSFRPRRGQQPDRAQLIDAFQASLSQLQLIRNGEFETHPIDAASGLEVAVGVSTSGSIIYELRVALACSTSRTTGFGVATEPGGLLSVGLETADIDPETQRRGMGARPGGRGRGGRRGGGGMGSGPGSIPEPLKAWAKLRLAADPEDARAQRAAL